MGRAGRPPLSAAGRDQARRLGLALIRAQPPAQRVVASDLRRAAETARIVADIVGLAPPQVDARLRERRAAWSGLTSAEIERRHPGLLPRWRAGTLRDLPGASEPWAGFVARVLAGLHDHARRPGVTLVVAHAGVFQVLPGAPCRRLANGEGVRLRRFRGELRAAPAPDPPRSPTRSGVPQQHHAT